MKALTSQRTRLRAPATEKIIFWSVAILLLGQLTWWISFQVRESRRLLQAQIAEMRAGREQAAQRDQLETLEGMTWADKNSIVGPMPRFRDLAERRLRIEQRFPYVAVVDHVVESDDPVLLDEGGKLYYITLRKDVLLGLERDRRLALWKVGVQAGLLVSVVLLGMGYIYRRLNVEMELMLRQRNFIAAVTHELKTPIASLRVWIETLFTRALPEERRERIHHLMDGDLSRLTDLVSNLLDVARAEAGRLQVLPEPVEMGAWLQKVIDAMDHRLGQGELGLECHLGTDVWASIDPRLFATVVENLLSNAFKYADPPRRTVVTLDAVGSDVVLVVKDQGAGFHPRESGRLFQRFYRVGDEMTRSVAGTGLGLFLSREIVQRHHGTIQATSPGRGLGATFLVRLPRLPR